MKNPAVTIGLILVGIFFTVHLILGIYAVYDGGVFGFGFNAPERLLYYHLSGQEFHFTVTGSMKYLLNDVCIQTCSSCPFNCYDPKALTISCAEKCDIMTDKGTKLASEGDGFILVMNNGITYTDAKFRCYGRECGFDVRMSENSTYSSKLPVKVHSQ